MSQGKLAHPESAIVRGELPMDTSEIDLVMDWLDFIEEWLTAKQYPEASHIVGVAKLSLEDARKKMMTKAA